MDSQYSGITFFDFQLGMILPIGFIVSILIFIVLFLIKLFYYEKKKYLKEFDDGLKKDFQKITNLSYKYIVILPLLFFFGFICLYFYINNINVKGPEYIQEISGKEKIINEEILDIKENGHIYVLTKDKIYILSSSYNLLGTLEFNNFGVNINPTGFGIDDLQNIYIVSEYKYIYTFKYKNEKYRLVKSIRSHKNLAYIADKAGNTGHNCIETNFKHIVDIVSPEINHITKDFILPELLILDTGYQKVLRCNGRFGHSKYPKHIDYSILSPRYLLDKGFIYNNNGNYENILSDYSSGKKFFNIKNVGRLLRSIHIIYKLHPVGNIKFFNDIQNKYNKEAKIIVPEYHDFNLLYEGEVAYDGRNRDYYILVSFRDEPGLYKIYYKVSLKHTNYFLFKSYIESFLQSIGFLLCFALYSLLLNFYLFTNLKREKGIFSILGYILMLSIIIITYGYFFSKIYQGNNIMSCFNYTFDTCIIGFFVKVSGLIILFINLIFSFILRLITKKFKNNIEN